MSIVAWDGKTIAADRQCTAGDLMLRATKIRRINNGDILAWTGTLENGMTLADWYERGADQKLWPTFQASDSWCRLIVVSKGRAYSYEQLPVKQLVEDRFAAWGSGRDLAMGALAMGATAVEAVKVASRFSSTCGMGVESFKVR